MLPFIFYSLGCSAVWNCGESWSHWIFLCGSKHWAYVTERTSWRLIWPDIWGSLNYTISCFMLYMLVYHFTTCLVWVPLKYDWWSKEEDDSMRLVGLNMVQIISSVYGVVHGDI